MSKICVLNIYVFVLKLRQDGEILKDSKAQHWVIACFMANYLP